MKTRTTFTLFLTAILTLAAGSAFGAYSGGSGTAGAPYKIATKTDLLALAAATADYGKCFILTADIDMIGQVFTAPIIAADGSPAFSGTFDGNGHKITNFTISEDYYDIGLFGSIIGGSVKNLGIENCSVVGYYYVGCLVGYNSGSISNCYSTGSVSGPSDSSNIGCLVGYNSGGTVSDCYSTGTAGGSSNVGCLVGWSSGTVSRCYATGSVTGDIIGGLVGENYSGGNISNCYSTGSVSGVSYIGGLVGINQGGNISNCYSAGSVSGSTSVGGLVGLNNSGSTVSSFWNTNTSGKTTSAGGTGKTTAQMKLISTFANWDFIETWGIIANQTYPYLMTGPAADLNHDGTVDFADFAIFAENWLAGE
jgi:hypothetical protein